MNHQNISQYFKVDKAKFQELGVFDRFIGVDTRLFVDPFLLNKIDVPEFIDARKTLVNYFKSVITILDLSKNTNDLYFKKAIKLLTFKEVKGVGIGFGKNTGDGNSVGKKMAIKLALFAKDLIQRGNKEPEIFEIMGLFQEDFGADRLSDITIKILEKNFINYTIRLSNELGINCTHIKYKNNSTLFPYIVEQNQCILLIPKILLRHIPISQEQDNIEQIVDINDEVRDKINSITNESWTEYLKSKKHRSDLIIEDSVAISQLIEFYKKRTGEPYNFQTDPKGEVIWKERGEQIARNNPLNLILTNNPSIEEVENVIVKIIEQFKKNVEYNGANKLMIKSNGKYSESFCQKIFYIVADSYCNSNNLDLTAEANGGRGPVDFKFSNGLKKIVVEMKLTSNGNFINGIKNQLPIYQKSENAIGIFLVIQTNEAKQQFEDLINLENQSKKEHLIFPKYFSIDVRIKKSASKIK